MINVITIASVMYRVYSCRMDLMTRLINTTAGPAAVITFDEHVFKTCVNLLYGACNTIIKLVTVWSYFLTTVFAFIAQHHDKD